MTIKHSRILGLDSSVHAGIVSGRRTCPAEALAKEEAAHPPTSGKSCIILAQATPDDGGE